MRPPGDKPLVDFIRDDLFCFPAEHTMQIVVEAGRELSQVGMRLARQMILRGMDRNTLAYDIVRRSYAFAMHYFTYLNVARVHDPHSSVGARYELADSTVLWADNIFRTGHADDDDDDGGDGRRRKKGNDTPSAINVIRHLLSLLHGMGYARYRTDVYAMRVAAGGCCMLLSIVASRMYSGSTFPSFHQASLSKGKACGRKTHRICADPTLSATQWQQGA
jgi:hypothetical protein